MNSRLDFRRDPAEKALAPMSVSDQRLLAGLSSAESRILGSAQLGTLSDIAIALLRVVTLIGAVLLPALQGDDPSTAPGPGSAPGPLEVIVVPIQTTAAASPTDITLNVNGQTVPGQLGNAVTRIEVIDHEPITLQKNGSLVLGSSAGYWYRTELGVNDYFWALPDGEFYFRVASIGNCSAGSNDECVGLEFEFDTRVTGQKQRGIVGNSTAGADGGGVPCPPMIGGILTCSYTPDVGSTISVYVRKSLDQGDVEPGKRALDVHWCEGTDCKPPGP